MELKQRQNYPEDLLLCLLIVPYGIETMDMME